MAAAASAVERVLVLGIAAPPAAVRLCRGGASNAGGACAAAAFSHDAATSVLTVRKPGATIGEAWELELPRILAT